MKKLITGTAILLILMTSCKKEEIEPTLPPTPPMETVDEDLRLVEELNLYYYGKEINIYQGCLQLVGSKGAMNYHLYQAEENDGTNRVTAEFHLSSPSSNRFKHLNFKLSINMNNKSCEITEVVRDQMEMSATNLILMLGQW